jgi:hypothetical protein
MTDLGILRNPWGHPTDVVRKARLDAADEIERLRAELDALRGQEPVAFYWYSSKYHNNEVHMADDLPAHTPADKIPLYAAPKPEARHENI